NNIIMLFPLADKISSHAVFTIACFFSYVQNRQQAAAYNVVVNKLNVIERMFAKYEKIIAALVRANIEYLTQSKQPNHTTETFWLSGTSLNNSLMQRENATKAACPKCTARLRVRSKTSGRVPSELRHWRTSTNVERIPSPIP